MTAYTKTISNTIGFIGGQVSQKWGTTMIWGTSRWGESRDFLQILVTHLISENLTLNDPNLPKSITHILPAESLSLADAFTKETARTISNSLTLAGDSSDQNLRDSAGYFYVFRRPTINNETTVNTDYTSQTAGAISFTSLVQNSTNWS